MNAEFRTAGEVQLYRYFSACDDPSVPETASFARWWDSLRKVQELLAYVARVS